MCQVRRATAFAAALFVSIAFPFFPLLSHAQETAIFQITVDHVPKGEFFVIPTPDGDFLLREEDFTELGFKSDLAVKRTTAGEGKFISLKALEGVSFSVNVKSLTIEITAPPQLLRKQVIDFSSQPVTRVSYPNDSSAFLNYIATATADTVSGFQGATLANQLGARRGNYLFLTETLYSKVSGESKFSRPQTNLTYDDRANFRRFVTGDILTTSGELGGIVSMGGISYSTTYDLNPSFITTPMVRVAGAAISPTEADIYLDGTKIRTEKLLPGTFELTNIGTSLGAGTVEVVLRDAFGREERIRNRYYSTNLLLKAGLHQYSYSAGFLRKDPTIKSNDYGPVALAAFHRYGRSDALTVGCGGEASSNFISLAPTATFLPGVAGVLNITAGASAGTEGRNGMAAGLRHTYNLRQFASRLLLKVFSEGYSSLENETLGEKRKMELGAGIGYSDKTLGSVALDFAGTSTYSGKQNRTTTLSYSRTVGQRVSLYALFQALGGTQQDARVFVGVNYSPASSMDLSARVEVGRDRSLEFFQVQKNLPVGEGFGYRATVERADATATSSLSFSPALQYNGRYGFYSADMRVESGAGATNTSAALSAGGSVVYLGDRIGFGRPVTDSFALVKVGELPGVTVYENSQEIGRTDSRGEILIPSLTSFYDNQISINDKDIPLNYTLPAILRYVSPPFRSGSCITLRAVKSQPITGKLAVAVDGGAKPLEFIEIKFRWGNREFKVPTGTNGEFYLDVAQVSMAEAPLAASECREVGGAAAGSPAGDKYVGEVEYGGKSLFFEMAVPKSEDIFIDVGTIVIEH